MCVVLLWPAAGGAGRALSASPAGVDAATSAPAGTAFTYQGTLKLNGALVDEVCDFRFSLWDAAADPATQVGTTQTHSAVPVSGGLFVIPALDFGPGAFEGSGRWLQLAVRCPAGSGSFVTLSPRQALNAAPYALYALAGGTQYTAGPGVVISGTQILADFAGSGAGTTVARSDHDHWGQTWEGDDFGLTIRALGNFGNSTAFTGRTIDQGTGVLGLATPSNASASLTVPAGVAGISLLPAGGFANRTYGVYGQASGTGGIGVFGTGTYTGTLGLASGPAGVGVFGESTGLNGSGVFGKSANGNGLRGEGINGVYAQSSVSNGTGVLGEANTGGLAFGVWGISSQGYAGYFSGKVNVTGNLTKGGGAFKIDHPLDPANQYLYHSFVESPDMKNIYDGVVTLDENGQATVTLPEWFEALNRDFRYQLTCIGGYAPVYIAQEVQNNTFVIAGGTPGLKVSWQVTGIRQDAWANDNRIPVEEPKPAEEVGTYLYPQGFGQPDTLSTDYLRQQQLAEDQKGPEADAPFAPAAGPGVWIGAPGESGPQGGMLP